MKLITKVLITVLIISGLMPLMSCIFAGFNQSMLFDMFGLSSELTPDMEKVLIIVGAAISTSALFQFLAASWLIKRKQEGYALAQWVGYSLILVGLYMLVFFSMHGIGAAFYAIDLVKGALIVTLAVLGKKKTMVVPVS